jgi:hypothetical protein
MMKTALLAVAASVAVLAQSAPTDPQEILAATREALGGEKKLSAVKTIVATGRTQQVRGNNLVPIEFEINIELPDKYVRKDEIPAQESGPSTAGFNGDALIETKAPTVKQDFARLMIGMFASSFTGYPLTFTYVGQGEAPQGTADVLEAKGAPNFTMRLFILRSTHLPIMISWQGAAPSGRGGPPARGAAPPPTAAAPAGPPPENRIYFADYRDVDGLKWPFRLRRALGADTVEETTFDRFRINAKIDAKKFQP